MDYQLGGCLNLFSKAVSDDRKKCHMYKLLLVTIMSLKISFKVEISNIQ